MKSFNVVIAGVGGQGVLLTSKIIAEAALEQGYDVKQSEVHGMAQRGGSVISHVRFGEKVHSPIVSEGDAELFIGFEPLETARYLHFVRKDGVVVYNNYRISSITVSIGAEKYPDEIEKTIKKGAKNVHSFDGTRLAVEAGDKRALNIVLLGASLKFLPLDEKIVLSTIEKNVKKKVLDINLAAFRSGVEALKLK